MNDALILALAANGGGGGETVNLEKINITLTALQVMSLLSGTTLNNIEMSNMPTIPDWVDGKYPDKLIISVPDMNGTLIARLSGTVNGGAIYHVIYCDVNNIYYYIAIYGFTINGVGIWVCTMNANTIPDA